MTIKLIAKDGTVRLEVHAKPGSKTSRIVGSRGDALEVALAAPPVEGAANEELVRLLASLLGVPKRNVEIVRGKTAKKKLVAVHGLDAGAVLAQLVPPPERR